MMTRDDIIEAARVGWIQGNATAPFPEKLLRKCIDAAVHMEREACATVAEEYLDDPVLSGQGYATGCARAIRERRDE